MICAIHDKINAGSNLTELSDNEFVPDKIIVMRDMFFEIFVAKITEITNDNIWIIDGWFNIC